MPVCRPSRHSIRGEVGSGEVLGVHDHASLLPLQLAQHLFRGTHAVGSCRVNFVVAMLLKHVQDILGGVDIVHARLLSSGLAKGLTMN